MVVGIGDNNTLVLAITEEELGTLREGRTLTFEGTRLLVKDIVVFWGRDKEHVIEILNEASVPFDAEMKQKYRKGERTDNPRRLS